MNDSSLQSLITELKTIQLSKPFRPILWDSHLKQIALQGEIFTEETLPAQLTDGDRKIIIAFVCRNNPDFLQFGARPSVLEGFHVGCGVVVTMPESPHYQWLGLVENIIDATGSVIVHFGSYYRDESGNDHKILIELPATYLEVIRPSGKRGSSKRSPRKD